MANNHGNLIQHLHPSKTFPILCRFCNQVISTNGALINHMELHIQQQEVPTESQDSQHHITYYRGSSANHFPNNVPAPMLVVAPPKSLEIPPARTDSFPRASNFFALALIQHSLPAYYQISSWIQSTPASQFGLREMEISLTDGTRSLVQMLEHHLKNIELIDLVEEDDHELDLKL